MSSTTSTSGRLSGRRILVTGAASGMGKAIADLFAAEGASLALLDLNADRLAKVGAATGQPTFTVDVSNEAQVTSTVDAAASALGGLDGVVNAAGILVHSPLEDTDFSTFRRLVDINLAGPFLVCQASLAHLRANQSATIVNIASMSAVRPVAGMGVYSATKAGLVALSHSMAYEWGPTIRVNTINPGVIRTPMTDYLFEEGSPYLETFKERHALKRAGEPSEVADLALFLTGPESTFLSTTAININGGSNS